MKRRHRILLSALAVAGSIALVLGFVLLGSATGGPLTTAMESVGGVVSRLEARAVYRMRGPGRSRSMEWLAPLRTHADALRDPPRILIGAYDDGLPTTLEGVLALERVLGTPLPLIQVYTAWGDRHEQRFPLRLLRAIADLGSIPVVTWEPWLVDFENRLHPDLPLRDQRDRGGLRAIAAGTYDFYIDAWAHEAARFGRPLLIRFGHEMNDPYRYPWGPQNNDPGDFIAAWRRVVDRFRAAGAHNAVWVWAPHLAYEGWEAYYPGDDWVDWVGTGVLNYGTVAYWSKWWTFDEIFGQRYDRFAALGKPIMIAEFGSLAVGGSRPEWLAQALHELPARFPAVRALLFFDVEGDRTVTYQALDWSVQQDSASVQAIRAGLRSW
jgi:hypothetical protein